MTPSNKLIPLNSGLQIKRSNNYVNTRANYTLSGSIHYNGLSNAKIVFNNSLTLNLISNVNLFNDRLLG